MYGYTQKELEYKALKGWKPRILQKLVAGKWYYVFCRNNGTVVLTTDNAKGFDSIGALRYFAGHFANDTFRLSREPAEGTL